MAEAEPQAACRRQCSAQGLATHAVRGSQAILHDVVGPVTTQDKAWLASHLT